MGYGSSPHLRFLGDSSFRYWFPWGTHIQNDMEKTVVSKQERISSWYKSLVGKYIIHRWFQQELRELWFLTTSDPWGDREKVVSVVLFGSKDMGDGEEKLSKSRIQLSDKRKCSIDIVPSSILEDISQNCYLMAPRIQKKVSLIDLSFQKVSQTVRWHLFLVELRGYSPYWPAGREGLPWKSLL